MDRRSWPWKKKSSDTKADLSELSPHSAKSHSEQVPRGSSADYTRPVDDSVFNRQQYEEKIKHLNEKLSVALAEITSKDSLAKQHAKVAEEAVSGWEKAETEAALLKKQLDAAVQQRSGLEDRAAHLDGALKECMRELRHVREEQEHKLHESFTKKTREWDRVRVDLEARLSSANDKLIEFEAHKSALSRSLQERAKTISEVNDAKARAEAATTVMQVQKEELERKCTALKYEVQVLSKEVEIRNEEKEYNKKMADAASKQQLEYAKKVAKLEAECQRLRGLVRKKLPGPAALAQMKLKVDGQGREHVDGKGRKSIGRSGSALAASVNSLEEVSQVDDKEGDALSERLLTMEEETKMLKEALAKKNQELQSARLMCARTASKLSNVEEQLEVLSRAQGTGNTGVVTTGNKLTSPTHDKCNSDERTSADSWASALVTQLEQFRKGNAGSNSDKLFESSNFDLMDDFIEMERLASTSSEQAASDKSSAASEIGVPVHDERVSLEEALSRKERECFELKKVCAELKKKLASADEQIRFLENKNNGNETTLASSLVGVTDMDRILAEARDRYALRKTSGAKDSSLFHQDSLDSKNRLKSAVSKLIRFVESLAQEVGAHHGLTSSQTSPSPSHECNIIDGQVLSGMQWNNLDLDIGIKKLVFASNNLLQGEGDVLHLIEELSSVLGLLTSLRSTLNVEDFTGQSYTRSSGDWNECGQSALFTSGDLSAMHKVAGSKRFSFFRNHNAPKFASSLDDSEGDTEFNSYAALEDDIAKLKAEKGNLEHKIHLADEKIERLKVQLSDSEQLVSNLRVQLASTEESKQLAENELAAMATIKGELESKVRASESLQDKIAAVESELQDQRARHEEVLSSLQKRIAQGAFGSTESPHQLSEETTRLQKEREIAVAAEKLAECQRTIAVLGKQLQSLAGSARGSIDLSEVSMSPADKNHRLDEPFSLKHEMLHSESEDEDAVQWTIDRTTSDRFRSRNARENIRKQEIYWSSASSAEANHDNGTEAASSRRSSMDGEFFANSPLEGRSSTYSKHGNSGFSRFFSRGKSSH